MAVSLSPHSGSVKIDDHIDGLFNSGFDFIKKKKLILQK